MTELSTIWAMYYSGIVAFQYHPKNTDNLQRLSVSDCAKVADSMLDEHMKRWDANYSRLANHAWAVRPEGA